MGSRDTILIGMAAVGCALAGYTLAPLIFFASQSLFPATVSWDAKNAFIKCEGAIARREWPGEPRAACAAMHLCANEATLSEPQMTALRAMARITPGCGDF